MIQSGREVNMKQTSEEWKPYTSSLNFCPEACCRKGWGWAEKHTHPLTTTLFTSWSVDISFTDDVTVLLILDVSFTRVPLHSQAASEIFRYSVSRICCETHYETLHGKATCKYKFYEFFQRPRRECVCCVKEFSYKSRKLYFWELTIYTLEKNIIPISFLYLKIVQISWDGPLKVGVQLIFFHDARILANKSNIDISM